MASGIGGTLRFVGLVTGITGLGAILTAETERHFVAAISGADVPGMAAVTARSLVPRIVSGDVAGAVAGLPEQARAKLLDLARMSFERGFAVVLLAAAAVAAIAALLTFVFVSAAETSPSHLHPAGEPPLPEVLD